MNILHKRQGQMEVGLMYFYTQSIHQMKSLLIEDKFKMEIISSLKYLVTNKFVRLYGYVIMPNHIHFLWKMEKHLKESPGASFSKFTAHRFKQHLKDTNPINLYKSEKNDRNYQFWKRDPLALFIQQKESFFKN